MSTPEAESVYRFRYRDLDQTTRRSTLAQSIKESPGDFISFLALVEALAIDIIPITWDPALNAVGHGGTAAILQSPVDLELSLAFKFPVESITRKPEFGSYHTLISEILVLANTATRYHPNLIMLEGICLDMNPEDGTVWPVFVFEKAREGDLYHFMSSRGQQLDLRDRLDLCKDVATAIQVLHACRIAHGDINPRNVLIFRDGAAFYAKVSDFGYSAVVIDDQNIGLPVTWPWNAPECDERWWFTFLEARKTDLYSFGLLCLWILFKDNLPEDLTSIKNDTCDKYGNSFYWVDNLKQSGSLQSFARDQVEQITTLSSDEKAGLQIFFRSILAEDPQSRELNLRYIPPLSKEQEFGHHQFEEWPLSAQFYMQTEADPAVHFQLSGILYDVLRDDFRLWEYIFRCLLSHACYHLNESCRKNAAFQLALCHELGIGCSRSTSSSREWLVKSGKPTLDLEDQLKVIKADKHVKKSLLQPFLGRRDFADKYKQDKVLIQARQIYEAAATNTELILGTIIIAQGYQREGEAMLNKLEEECQEKLTDENPFAIKALYLFYMCQGQWEKAEPWTLRSMDLYERMTIDVNPNVKEHHLSSKAITSFNLGRVAEGIELAQQNVDFWKQVHGSSYPRTLAAISNLAAMYIRMKRFAEAKQLLEEAIKDGEKVLPKDDLNILYMSSRLACIQRTRQECREGEKLYQQILSTYRRVLGDEDIHTLDVASDLADTLLCQGRWREAEEILVKNVKIRTKVFGEETRKTLNDIVSLVNVYYVFGKGRLGDELALKVIDRYPKLQRSNRVILHKDFDFVARRHHRRKLLTQKLGVFPVALLTAMVASIEASYALMRRLLHRYF